MEIRSLAFAEKQSIPSLYTCDGSNMSPPLFFENISEQTQSLVLIVHDPDAPMGDFTHWLVWNIPPDTKEIDAGELPEKAREGTNDFNGIGYTGPCPPSGVHRYFFELYALDNDVLSLSETSTRAEVEAAINGHILEKATLIGTYQRQ